MRIDDAGWGGRPWVRSICRTVRHHQAHAPAIPTGDVRLIRKPIRTCSPCGTATMLSGLFLAPRHHEKQRRDRATVANDDNSNTTMLSNSDQRSPAQTIGGDAPPREEPRRSNEESAMEMLRIKRTYQKQSGAQRRTQRASSTEVEFGRVKPLDVDQMFLDLVSALRCGGNSGSAEAPDWWSSPLFSRAGRSEDPCQHQLEAPVCCASSGLAVARQGQAVSAQTIGANQNPKVREWRVERQQKNISIPARGTRSVQGDRG